MPREKREISERGELMVLRAIASRMSEVESAPPIRDGSSYREWAAAQKDRERRERQAEKGRLAAEGVARDEEAAAKTQAVERRVAELESLLRSPLTRDARISLDSLRSTATIATDQFRASGDGGIDCMAYRRDPVAP
jgi:hypothetical protein